MNLNLVEEFAMQAYNAGGKIEEFS